MPSGEKMNDQVAKCPTLFHRAARSGVLTIGIGDGGNEIGWGIVADVIRDRMPYGRNCACGCGGGFGDVTPADVCVVASVSNWGAYGVAGCLAALLGRPELLHDLPTEARMIRACVDSGGVDGVSGRPELRVDGLPEDIQRAILIILHEIVQARNVFPSMKSE